MSGRIRQELIYFFSGLSFYTRVPCPAWVPYSPHNLNKSRKYLPLIGLLIGVIAALIYMFCGLLMPSSVSISLSMIATVYLTGAFHEDGLADCADGFGGGWEKAQILAIMKDSRIGVYGTIILVLILGLKFILLMELQLISDQLLMLALMVGHSLSRLMSSLTMQFYDYVSELSSSKSQSVTSVKLNGREMLWSISLPILGLLSLFIFSLMVGSSIDWLLGAPYLFVIAVLAPSLIAYTLAKYYQRRIGGYTGDCLGATQQLTEIAFYIVLIIH